MSFSFLGALANLMPGYIQGRRQAVQDNWQDLKNYNDIQAGQQANAFTEATWQPRLDMFFDNANLNNLRLRRGIMDYNIARTYYPGQLDQGWMYSQNAGLNQYWQNQMQNQAIQQMLGNRNLFQQMLMQGQHGAGTTPSAVQIGG